MTLCARPANRGFVQVAKQALLWERAVTQRLRSQLDMAEAQRGEVAGGVYVKATMEIES